MLLNFEERLSDSPFVERVWRTHSERAGSFISLALSHWQLCVWKHQGQLNFTVRGPETLATPAYCPEDAEFFGIVFKHGTFMPNLPAANLVDGAVTLPQAQQKSFWLDSTTWQFPTYENADTFVNRLVRRGLLVREPVVAAALQGYSKDLSPRSVQRYFVRSTGLSQQSLYQIERARQAILLLKQGVPVLDTVHHLGYSDQAHLIRALRRFAGQTPAQISSKIRAKQLSFLFNTTPFC